MIKYDAPNINTREYWNEIWTAEGTDTWRQYEGLFSRIAELVQPNSTVLDLGCGVGVLLKLLATIKSCDAHGVDISDVAIKLIHGLKISGEVSDVASYSIPIGKYDYILSTETLEHLDDPFPLLSQMENAANKGVLITVPDACKPNSEIPEHLWMFSRVDFPEFQYENFGDKMLLYKFVDA